MTLFERRERGKGKKNKAPGRREGRKINYKPSNILASLERWEKLERNALRAERETRGREERAAREGKTGAPRT